ncbi:MAG: Flp family type IVb pilin [Anaeromicrobium sp.]|jgi:pilus assembly protein Flp/PilA|uniref:Flp family type IVb pilin n=1 Tax=Anaeromicrobium sp. TaxID=1929132 RepID=UPI0025EF2AB4|nr:Flp family type IVb pilin [Anaeromicrobium sp.]MCT4595109.1 Flp family type IVb pilin [Anaeromicrobium sp.]
MLKKLKALITEEKGQGMTEYGLILGAIAVAVIAIIALFGPRITAMFTDTLDSIDPPAGS